MCLYTSYLKGLHYESNFSVSVADYFEVTIFVITIITNSKNIF